MQRMVRSEEMLEAEVNGEIVALHIAKGKCYGLNGVASRIWTMLADPVSAEEICASLGDEYDVDASTCCTEVAELMAELQSEGLIKPA
jgi:hypothetical protein